MNLPTTTTERLRVVADHIEAHPNLFDMGYFVSGDEIINPEEHAGRVDCGTACCAAGWGVAFTPPEQINSRNWMRAGGIAFGLDDELGDRLFLAVDLDASGMAGVLRALADMPEEDRTWRNVDIEVRDLIDPRPEL